MQFYRPRSDREPPSDVELADYLDEPDDVVVECFEIFRRHPPLRVDLRNDGLHRIAFRDRPPRSGHTGPSPLHDPADDLHAAAERRSPDILRQPEERGVEAEIRECPLDFAD